MFFCSGVTRTMGSLLGFFVTKRSLESFVIPGKGNPICKKTEMKEFEKEYSGTFLSFDKTAI